MAWVISRPIEGVTINGKEYILDEDGELMKFDSIGKAKEFLAGYGYSEREIELEGIDFEEVER